MQMINWMKKQHDHFDLLSFIFLIVLVAFSNQALAAYNFSSTGAATTAPNCVGDTNGLYTCSAGLTIGTPNNMVIDNSAGPVTINVNGSMVINETVFINSGANQVIFNVNGDLTIYGFTVGNAAAAGNTAFYVTGNVTATSSTIHADIFATGSGNIQFGTISPRRVPYLNGSLRVNTGKAYVNGPVQGCVNSNSGNAGTITLGSADSVLYSGVRCGLSGGTSCVINNSGRAMPGACTIPYLVAGYSMDELAWGGSVGEVLDRSGNAYNATAKIKSGSALPVTASSIRAISGNPGTCGYGKFTGTQYIDLPAAFPHITNSMTIAAWIKTTDRTIAQRIFADDQTNKGGYALTLTDWGRPTGAINFFKRDPNGYIYDVVTPGIIQNNTWYFVAVSVIPSTSQAVIYIYDQSGNLLNSTIGNVNSLSSKETGTASIAGENLASSETFGFIGDIDELSVYADALTQSQVEVLRARTHLCFNYSAVASNFNCVATGANAATGHLYTQLVGNAFNFDLVALNADNGVETSYVNGNAASKNVTLELVDGTGNTTCASRTALNPAVTQTVTFNSADAGRKTVTATVAKAYRDLRCRVIDANQSTNIVSCSTDDFSVRPTSFTVTSSNTNTDATGASVTATPIIKAGAAFNLTATSGVVGYDGTPSIDASKISAHTGAIQAGVISGSFNAANATTGIATANALSYSEVGYFNLAANGVYDSAFTVVDSANGDCSAGFTTSGGLNACNFGNSAITSYFGRFVPDHFQVTAASAGTPNPAKTCGTFSYFGQPNFTTVFDLTAQNASNATTKNYTGSFAKLNLANWTSFGFTATNIPASSSFTGTTSGSWLNGVARVTALHTVGRPTAAVAPTNITVNAYPTDSDGVTPLVVTPVAGASEFRFGQLNFTNVHGSELLPLSFVMQAQYYDGAGYRLNTSDNCSSVPKQSIVMDTYTRNLAACETILDDGGNGTFSSGQKKYTLSKPGAGNNGSVNMTANLNASAGGTSTCTASSQSTASALALPQFGTIDVTRRATFGVYKSPLVYTRESF